jgi:hypothetical protein
MDQPGLGMDVQGNGTKDVVGGLSGGSIRKGREGGEGLLGPVISSSADVGQSRHILAVAC